VTEFSHTSKEAFKELIRRELSSSEFLNDSEFGMSSAIAFLRHVMRIVLTLIGIAVVGISGCNALSSPTPVPPTPNQTVHDYTGAASVGDFLTIKVDSAAKSIGYENRSNRDSATAQFNVQADGSYRIDDPTGNFAKVYEVPGRFLIAEANKLGIDHNKPALITAVVSKPISVDQLSGEGFNYMEFRSVRGGFSIGTFHMDSQGNVAISCYVPFGDYFESTPFNRGTFPAMSLEQDPSRKFLKVGNPDGSFSYVFSTDDAFVVDRPDGVTLGFKNAATKEFDPSVSGTYRISLFEKLGASSTSISVETGNVGFEEASLVVSADGHVDLTDSNKHVVAQGLLTPIADVSYLFNGGIFSIDDPCNGMFALHIASATSQQDLFFGFDRHTAIFAGFRTNLPLDRSNTYDYFYGVALKQ
jgi:hypothetical protein